jgi:hypothetical protein
MDSIKETNNTQYVNGLHDIEKNNNTIVKAEETLSLVKAPLITDECCGKSFIAIMSTIFLSPFAICDVYFASTDETCVNQNCNDLAINMQSYLMASGIIMFVGIGLLNISIFCYDYDVSKKYDDEITVGLYMFDWISRLFGLSWLITGCVLFWAYMDISVCAKPVKNYLFARFILALIFSVMSAKTNSNNNNNNK